MTVALAILASGCSTKPSQRTLRNAGSLFFKQGTETLAEFRSLKLAETTFVENLAGRPKFVLVNVATWFGDE